MGYRVGIDLGTTYTAAAVYQDQGLAGQASVFTLGNNSSSIPSVLALKDDGSFAIGESAVQFPRPERIAREFKRQLGRSEPVFLGRTPCEVEVLTSHLLHHVVGQIAKVNAGPPDSYALTHPANWGQHKLDRFKAAVDGAGLSEAKYEFLPEPVAAGLSFGNQTTVRLDDLVAVYDLGGGTFDAAVLRRSKTGYSVEGKATGIDQLGGMDFDATIFNHLVDSIGRDFDRLDPDDTDAMLNVARLREDCVIAKEILSSELSTSIRIFLPSINVSKHVTLSRDEFERMIRTLVTQTIGSLSQAIESAGVKPEEISKILMAGGSSKIPLVRQMVKSEFGRPVGSDAHPNHAVCLGASIKASGLLSETKAERDLKRPSMPVLLSINDKNDSRNTITIRPDFIDPPPPGDQVVELEKKRGPAQPVPPDDYARLQLSPPAAPPIPKMRRPELDDEAAPPPPPPPPPASAPQFIPQPFQPASEPFRSAPEYVAPGPVPGPGMSPFDGSSGSKGLSPMVWIFLAIAAIAIVVAVALIASSK